MIYVTDTHSLLWFITKDKKLGSNAKTILLEADQGDCTILIPTIVLAEIAYILENKNYPLRFEAFIRELEHSANYATFNLTLDVIKDMQRYKSLKDIHDRIIVATATIAKAPLLTKDKHIMLSGYVQIIW